SGVYLVKIPSILAEQPYIFFLLPPSLKPPKFCFSLSFSLTTLSLPITLQQTLTNFHPINPPSPPSFDRPFFHFPTDFMEFSPERRLPAPADTKSEPFAVEDLLDFSNDDGTFDTSSPVLAAGDSCNSSSISGLPPADHHFSAPASLGDVAYRSSSGDICVPYDDAAELEWLSNFVEEESFSSEDLQKLHLISGLSNSTSPGPTKARSDPTRNIYLDNADDCQSLANSHPLFRPESLSVPAKARSKRSRAAPGSWASRLQVLSNESPTGPFPKPEHQTIGPGPSLKPGKKKGGGGGEANGTNVEGRRCLHCATDKTPQWRTGPMGPKTLCNACGVRYKSGRLVPEYRPAASPTFVLTKHSNSHRKVMELRRQKEQQVQGDRHHHHHHHGGSPQFIHGGMVFDVSNPDEYLIHQHVGPDFRQLI
ncbi:hypothetical protein V2J09_005289, partial [Rumex salicifolius]